MRYLSDYQLIALLLDESERLAVIPDSLAKTFCTLNFTLNFEIS